MNKLNGTACIHKAITGFAQTGMCVRIDILPRHSHNIQVHMDKLKLVFFFPLQHHYVKTVFSTSQRKISYRKTHHAFVFLTELRLKHNRFTEGGAKT